MTGSERDEVGNQPTHAVTHIQQEAPKTSAEVARDDDLTADLDVLDLLAFDETGSDGTTQGVQKEHAAAEAGDNERLRQRLKEHKLIEELRLENFSGAKYEILKAELVAYSIPVLIKWMRTGKIYAESSKLNRAVNPTEQEQELLANNVDNECSSLAAQISAEGLVVFRKALLEGKWSPLGGASLRTYFIGSCKLAFAKCFRRWRNEVHDSLNFFPCGGYQGNTSTSPEDAVLGTQFLVEELDKMPKAMREIIARSLVTDETFKKIAEELGLPGRAIEGILRRFREKNNGEEWRGQ